jgi:hypothetical protein
MDDASATGIAIVRLSCGGAATTPASARDLDGLRRCALAAGPIDATATSTASAVTPFDPFIAQLLFSRLDSEST